MTSKKLEGPKQELVPAWGKVPEPVNFIGPQVEEIQRLALMPTQADFLGRQPLQFDSQLSFIKS